MSQRDVHSPLSDVPCGGSLSSRPLASSGSRRQLPKARDLQEQGKETRMANQDIARYAPRSPMPLSEAVNQLMRDAFTNPYGFGAVSTLAAGMNLYEPNHT